MVRPWSFDHCITIGSALYMKMSAQIAISSGTQHIWPWPWAVPADEEEEDSSLPQARPERHSSVESIVEKTYRKSPCGMTVGPPLGESCLEASSCEDAWLKSEMQDEFQIPHDSRLTFSQFN